tara:strand:+ start:90 stop:422 length:333 start_codon:yes stop_codon:yes gene_type:complete
MTSYNIGIKGEDFFNIEGGSLKSEYNNFDELNFINYNETSPIINIFNYNKAESLYKLNASSGYILYKGHPSFTSFTNYNFRYKLAFAGDYEVFIVNPTFVDKGYSFTVLE